MSYFFAVKILISARVLWPELFDTETVAVEAIPSGGLGDTPSIRRSIAGIVPRMTTDTAFLKKYRLLEKSLQDRYRLLTVPILALGTDTKSQGHR